MGCPVLEMRGITKSFFGVRVLNDVTFSVDAGEVHSLVGENGAGKSTLMKILAGAYQPDAGEIYLAGTRVTIPNPRSATRLGIGIIYQETNLIPYFDVARNIFLGHEPLRAPGVIDYRRLYAEAEAVLARLGVMNLHPKRQVGELSVAEQQMVEIAKAVSLNSKILIMDEPTAALTFREVDALFKLIATLKSQGITIIYISHRLDEVLTICDTVTVLKDGCVTGRRPVKGLTKDELIRLMVGRPLNPSSGCGSGGRGEELLRVEGLTRAGKFYDVSFTVHAGEIVGIAGLAGSGRTEVVRAIFGADPVEAGSIYVMGKKVKINSPAQAVRLGLSLVPEDRQRQGLVQCLSARKNLILASLRQASRFGFVRRAHETSLARRMVDSLNIKVANVDQEVRCLSGGNQQKVVLGKWLAAGPRVLLVDEPTRGVDVGSKAKIYRILRGLAAEGLGILVISSELPEVLAISDRILVMARGRIVGEIAAAEATEEKLMRLMTGGGATQDNAG